MLETESQRAILQSCMAGLSNPGMWNAPLGSQEAAEGHGCTLIPWQALRLEDSYVDKAVGSRDGLFHNPVLSP